MAERRVKTFDEVMKKIKKDNYAEFRETCESLKDMEKLRVDAIIEMIKFDEDFKITNKSKKVTKVEDNGLLIYKCDKPSYLEESIEKHFDTVRIEASDVAKVMSIFSTNNLELKNCDELPLHGRIIFDNEQKIESLTIKDTAVRGKFNVSKVSIDGMTYLDIYLDADDKCEQTELIIRPNTEVSHRIFMEETGKNIRGSINLSVNFYNKLSKENKIKIMDDANACAVHFLIAGIPIYFYNNIKFKNIDIEEARKQLMVYKKEYGEAISEDVLFEKR